MARLSFHWPSYGIPAAVLGTCLLAGCGAFDRNVPDEFSVTTRAPLVIPNDFSLPPPRPGVERAQELQPRLQAQAALVPELALSGSSGPDSPGQQALVKAAGPPAPREIRQMIERDAGRDTGPGLADTLLFWKSAPPADTPIDPRKEAVRLRQRGIPVAPAAAAAASRLPATSTNTGLLDRLF